MPTSNTRIPHTPSPATQLGSPHLPKSKIQTPKQNKTKPNLKWLQNSHPINQNSTTALLHHQITQMMPPPPTELQKPKPKPKPPTPQQTKPLHNPNNHPKKKKNLSLSLSLQRKHKPGAPGAYSRSETPCLAYVLSRSMLMTTTKL
jgi:hypothetical protein